MALERLQKYISSCGVCSRRKAEELILNNKVKVNGKIVNTLGTKVSSNDVVYVNDKLIEKNNLKYYVMNKPRGIICTLNDPLNRKTIIDILPEEIKKEHVFPVGRLDYDTKGVILLTNDGDFMNAMVGPKSGVEKEYLVRVKGIIGLKEIKMLTNGVKIGNKLTLPSIVSVISYDNEHESTLISLTITEGANHQVKNMIKAIGFSVKKLTRVRFGHININGLKEGEIVRLGIHDVKVLYSLSQKNKVLSNY